MLSDYINGYLSGIRHGTHIPGFSDMTTRILYDLNRDKAVWYSNERPYWSGYASGIIAQGVDPSLITGGAA